MNRVLELVAETTLGCVERATLALVRPDTSRPCPVVFVVGAPRSGTTLLYQALLQRFRFVYFSNLGAAFYRAPTFAQALERLPPFSSGAGTAFESRFGRTRGWRGPHEAARFWYRWFPSGEDVYVAPGATPRETLDGLRREVAGMIRVGGAPALFKNTFNSMRIAPLCEAFPEASFLVCSRDIVDVATSILRARVAETGRKDGWWSVPPREFPRIRHHPYWRQVVEQAHFVCNQIAADRERFGEERFLEVRYEALCDAPRDQLDRVGGFLAARGVAPCASGELPERFVRPNAAMRRLEPDDDEERIRRFAAGDPRDWLEPSVER